MKPDFSHVEALPLIFCERGILKTVVKRNSTCSDPLINAFGYLD